MKKSIILFLFLISCGKEYKEEPLDNTPWAINNAEFKTRTCKDYLFIYTDNTINGYYSLDLFLMWKVNLKTASNLVAQYCTKEF